MAISQPPPPPLRPEIENLVFTHKSLFGKPASIVDDSEDPQDWERVAFLGEGILLAAMSRVLYYAYPRRRTSTLKPHRTQLLSKEALASITDEYRFMEKLKCLEPSRPNISRSLDNRAALAESFVGGLALEYGVDKARKWAEEMLAWKHNLSVPMSDEERLGADGKSGLSEGKDTVMNDVGGKVPVGAMAAPPPPAAAPPPMMSPPPVSIYAQPSTVIPPRVDYGPIRPPQEVPKPTMDFEIPVQQPMYDPTVYQAGILLPEMATVGGPTTTTSYKASVYYPHSSFQAPLQPTPYKQAPISPPAGAPYSPPPQPSDYINFKYLPNTPAQPSFFDSLRPHPLPPPPVQPQPPPQFESPTKPIAAWPPQVPGANTLPFGSPTSSGLKAVPSMEKGGPPSTKAASSSYASPAPPSAVTGFVTVAKLNEQAQKRCQRLEWKFDSQGQGQYISWTAQLYVRGDLVAEGRGQSKQIAKELAAQNAIEALGWK